MQVLSNNVQNEEIMSMVIVKKQDKTVTPTLPLEQLPEHPPVILREAGKNSAEARGLRAKSLRMMAGLSRKNMAAHHDISAGTLQGWEDGRYGGLTRKGAQRFLLAIRQEGIACTLEWILEGTGIGPQVSEHLFHKKFPMASVEMHRDQHEVNAIRDELSFFGHRHPKAVHCVVLDDGMTPLYHIGDTLAGVARMDAEIEQLIGYDCIVGTQTGDVYVRHLERGAKHGIYDLMCKNPDTSVLYPTLHDMELSYAAPIIWVRRPDPVS